MGTMGMLIVILGICCSLLAPVSMTESVDSPDTAKHHRVSRQLLPFLTNLFGGATIVTGEDLVDFATHQDQLYILNLLDLDRTNLTELVEQAKRNATLLSQVSQKVLDAQTTCNTKVTVQLVTLTTGQYYFGTSTQLKNWYEAKEYCRSVGLELASIETVAENDALVVKVKELMNGVTPSDVTFFWIGLNDLGVTSTWVWSGTGLTATYFNWLSAISAPSQVCDEHCVEMFYYTTTDVRWNDRSCGDWKGRFICERPSPCTNLLAL